MRSNLASRPGRPRADLPIPFPLPIPTANIGLLFSVQVVVYVLFSLIAAEAAVRCGEWPSILGGAAVWSTAMFLLGPIPAMHAHIDSHKAAMALIASSLAVLGASETFVFVPFVSLFHRYLRGPDHGWGPRDAEDAVAALWTTGKKEGMDPF
jgi:hypothetical protein